MDDPRAYRHAIQCLLNLSVEPLTTFRLVVHRKTANPLALAVLRINSASLTVFFNFHSVSIGERRKSWLPAISKAQGGTPQVLADAARTELRG